MLTVEQGESEGGGRSAGAAQRSNARVSSMSKFGIWIQGVDRLGAAYEGVWRVIQRFLLASEGAGKSFCFVAPERFREEIEEFLADLPDSVRSTVDFHGVGDASDTYFEGEPVRQATLANDVDVDGWLVPNPMWSAAKHLVKPKVVWFHDFLLAEFPQSYPYNLYVEFQENVRELQDSGSFFIFLSPHVQRAHGHDACEISPDRSMLVITPALEVESSLAGLPDDPRYGGDWIRSELSENLRSWCTPAHAELFYHHISTYPFESVPYFFVSSQNREHKAFLRLAQIHASMLRKHYLPYSIFTTALVDVLGQSPLERFLKTELLMGDFMSVGKVSDLTHAFLYKFARMTLHPSTFEGNLPLPFAESVALGTPCIMPYSKAFIELVDEDLHPWVFYSPTEPGLIAKVVEVESRRPEFLAAQQQVLRKMRSYSLKDYFALQMQAFEKAARTQPDAARYLFNRKIGTPVARPNTLRSRYKLALRKLDTVVSGSPAWTSAKIWPRFELVAGKRDLQDQQAVLHWAEYLGSAHPKGESYFVLSVDGASSADLAQSGLFAELGAWGEDGYFAADSRPFEFDVAGLPPAVLEVANDAGLDISDGRTIGWTKLDWRRGDVPEIRIGGKKSVGDVKARLVCVAGTAETRKSAKSAEAA